MGTATGFGLLREQCGPAVSLLPAESSMRPGPLRPSVECRDGVKYVFF